jgi:hypothetical protein
LPSAVLAMSVGAVTISGGWVVPGAGTAVLADHADVADIVTTVATATTAVASLVTRCHVMPGISPAFLCPSR